MQKTHLIIGASAAGLGALNTLRMLDHDAEIIGITDQKEYPYNTCWLADYAAGLKNRDQLCLLPPAKVEDKRIHLLRGRRVIDIMSTERRVQLDDGSTISYDTLLVATGTMPYVPSITNLEGPGVFPFHRLSDIDAIHAYIQQHAVKKLVVIGAGLSGLEAADAFHHQGLQVSVVERASSVLTGLFSGAAATQIEIAMRNQQVALYSNEMVVEIVRAHDGRPLGCRLASGTELPADMIIFAVGVKPQLELLHKAGIVVGSQGVAVDAHMQTTISGIYAAGDIIMAPDQLSGQLVPSRTWPDAMFQGLVAAHAMAGKEKRYPGLAVITSSAFFGLKVASCGYANGFASSIDDLITVEKEGKHATFALEQGRLRGFLIVGDCLQLTMLKKTLLTGALVEKERILEGF